LVRRTYSYLYSYTLCGSRVSIYSYICTSVDDRSILYMYYRPIIIIQIHSSLHIIYLGSFWRRWTYFQPRDGATLEAGLRAAALGLSWSVRLRVDAGAARIAAIICIDGALLSTTYDHDYGYHVCPNVRLIVGMGDAPNSPCGSRHRFGTQARALGHRPRRVGGRRVFVGEPRTPQARVVLLTLRVGCSYPLYYSCNYL